MSKSKPLWRKLLEEARNGIIGNIAYDVLRKWILPAVLVWLTSLIPRAMGAVIPATRDVLSTEVLSTKVVVTVGTLTSIAFPALALAAIWFLFARKRRSETREYKQEVMKLNQRVAELERHKKNLLETQRSNLDRSNRKTRELNELRSRLREQTIFKAVYYDSDYMTGWIENPEAVANFFAERGFEVLNASQLGRWVDERIEYNESCRSLLVFAQDRVPDTVADLRSDTCKLRLFLNNGARVVWHGDVPFWYQAWPRKRHEEWGADGPSLVLRVTTILMDSFFRDQSLSGILTEKGHMWGMVLPGPAQRAVPTREVDDVFTVGPSTDPQTDTACAWRKIYSPRFPHSGFLRYWPGGRDGQAVSINTDFFRFAVSGWSAVPEVEFPEIEVAKPYPHEPVYPKEFHEDFQDGLENWEHSGEWRTEREGDRCILIVTKSERGGIAKPCLSWTDYVFEFETRIVNGNSSWIIRARDTLNYVMLQCQQERLYPHLRMHGNWFKQDSVILPITLPLNTWFGARIDVRGAEVVVTVTVNDRKWEILNSSTLLEPSTVPVSYPMGSVGFRESAAECAHFRNVRVKRLF